MKVRVDWIGDMRFLGGTENDQRIVMEASKSEQRVRTGASPMETALIDMGGCSSYDVVNILKKLRRPLKNLWFDLQASRASSVPAVFTAIHMGFAVVRYIPLAKAEEAVRLSIEKYCSASKMIGLTAGITTEVKIENN